VSQRKCNHAQTWTMLGVIVNAVRLLLTVVFRCMDD
jgi:hypothetical protein